MNALRISFKYTLRNIQIMKRIYYFENKLFSQTIGVHLKSFLSSSYFHAMDVLCVTFRLECEEESELKKPWAGAQTL
jgi:hypothetical protein